MSGIWPCAWAAALPLLWALCAPSEALGQTLDVGQYGHTSWTTREGLVTGTSSPSRRAGDGLPWLASETAW